MESESVLILSRLQFAFTAMFHYIFPPLAIGMGVLLVFFEGMYLKTKNPLYESITKFWVKIFGLNFAIGVASGIVLEFEFGTNWSVYSRFVGDVFGSALAAEGIFAFFLESGFLALLVFGWDRVSPRVHFFSTIMVSLGSIFSSVWIVVANSWQQTPTGYHLVERTFEGVTTVRAEITDFWALVFNPSSVDRLLHVWFGAFIVGGFFVMSISAYYLLKGRHLDFAKKSFSAALVLAAIASVLALVQGHGQAVTVSQTQPAKMAAFEGIFETSSGGTPLCVIGYPDEEAGEMKGAVNIPGLLSYLVHGDTSKPVTGLDAFAPEDRPPLFISFASYHIMIGLGMLFIFLTLLGLFFLWRGTLFEKRWLLWIFVLVVVAPFVGNEVGWVAAEVGRQPWIVYGELRTADAFSPNLSNQQVLSSIIMFGVIYLLLFAVWIFVLNDKIKKGPEAPKVAGAGGAPTGGGDKGLAGLMDAASEIAAHEGSMTTAKDESKKGKNS